MAQWAYYNNDFVLESDCAVPAGDLAVQRGYGVFDFFRTVAATPLFLDEHLQRFQRSAAELRLPIGKSDAELKTIFTQLIQKNALPDSGIRLTLTGGLSPDGFAIARPNLIITQQPMSRITASFEQGIRLATYKHQRQLPQAKTIYYLMAIWLQPWLTQNSADDVLYFSNDGVTECPRANFFIITAGGIIITPANNVLKGITRAQILRLAGEKANERPIALAELKTAQEAFITSTTRQILPVTAIDGVAVGNGKPGPITRWLAEQLMAEIRRLV